MARILLVEDETDLRDNFKIILSHAGHEVVTAGNGREALAVLHDRAPDLVVSDVMMPEMDGMEFLSVVRREMPALAEMPVILLTALAGADSQVEGRTAGADDYLTKPVRRAELVAAVEARLRRARDATARKEKQFVRLYRSLSEQADAAAAAPPTPLERLGAVAGVSLKGRSAILCPDDFIPGFAGLPAAERAKAADAVRRVAADTLAPDDVAIDLGAGAMLVVTATTDAQAARERLTLMRARLVQLLGPAASPAGSARAAAAAAGTSPGGAPSEVDDALHGTLTRLFDRVLAAENDPAGGGLPPDVAAVARTVRVDFVPLWNARTQMVDGHRLRYRRRVGNSVLPESQTLLLGAEDPLLSALQSAVMDAAIAALGETSAGAAPLRHPPLLIVPCCASLGTRSDASPVERRLEELSAVLDGGALALHLTRTGESVPLDLVQRTIDRTGIPAARIVTDLDVNGTRLDRLAALGCRMLHADLSAVRTARLRRERLAQAMQDAIRTAVQAGFEVWASNADLSTEGRQVVAAGAGLLSGRVVGEGRAIPERTTHLSASRVFLTM